MPKPPPPVLTPLTPHISITGPAAGDTFKGGTNPDTIPVQGTVFLTCDDPGGDCDVGRISGVSVKLGDSDAAPATLKLDPTPAQGTEQSGSWQFSGVPGPSEAGSTVITATLTMREGARRATASTSITVDVRNGGGTGLTCAELTQQLINLNNLLAHIIRGGGEPPPPELLKRITGLTLLLQEQGCTPVPLQATLTGKVMIETDRAGQKGPFDEDISLALVFSGNEVSVGPIDLTASGIHVTSNGGLGTFDPSSGLMQIEIPVQGSKGNINLNLDFKMSTESGEAHGPFTPQGVRLGPDGSVILAGAAFDTVFGVGVNVFLLISGAVSPHP